MKKRKVWRWVLIGLLAVAIVVVVLLLTAPAGSTARYTEETVRGGDIETYYSFSGNVGVRNSQQVAAKVNATVREVYVQQDQLIEADEALLRLSTGDIIRADIAGEVTDVHVEVGDTVSIGTPLVDIIDFTDLQVVFKVDEFDVAAVAVGKEATVTVDALALTYTGEVEHIAKWAQSVGDLNYYEAKVAAPEDGRVLPGMKVDVRVVGEHAEDAALLSMGALRFDAYNKPYVYVKDSAGKIGQVSVGVGIQDGTTVQITEGLRVGDVVQVPASQSLFPMMGRFNGS